MTRMRSEVGLGPRRGRVAALPACRKPRRQGRRLQEEAAVACTLRRPGLCRSFQVMTIESTDRYMSAFTKVAGRAPARLLALAVLSTLATATNAIAPAAAQQEQAKQTTPPQTPNEDLRLATELGFEYRLSPQWRLKFGS